VKYRLAWFLGAGFGIQAWNPSSDGPWTGTNVSDWMKPDLYVDLTSALERGGFDFVLVEDTSQVDDSFRGSAETTLRLGLWAPKNDPLPLVPLMAQRSRHVGIVATITTTFYPPYLAARLLTTLDHLTNGRVGVNVVTGGSDLAGANYGFDRLPEKDLRYEMAAEWVDIVNKLHQTWEPGAILADQEHGIYADYAKVKPIDFVGTYFKCRGPLNTIPGPQGRIPVVEAGNSPAGRDLAARTADSMIAQCQTVEDMKEIRRDMHQRLRSYGRDPDSFKMLFLCSPMIAATDDDAQRKLDAYKTWRQTDAGIESMLWYMEHVSGLDFGNYNLRMTVTELIATINSIDQKACSSLAKMFKGQEGLPLRDVVAKREHIVDLGLVGSVTTVANKMDQMMEEVGGDGFLFYLPTTRHQIAEVCDGLCPVLQRRGSIRSNYPHATFRENLLSF
jgi:long-chain alkane monooxygenase